MTRPETDTKMPHSGASRNQHPVHPCVRQLDTSEGQDGIFPRLVEKDDLLHDEAPQGSRHRGGYWLCIGRSVPLTWRSQLPQERGELPVESIGVLQVREVSCPGQHHEPALGHGLRDPAGLCDGREGVLLSNERKHRDSDVR